MRTVRKRAAAARTRARTPVGRSAEREPIWLSTLMEQLPVGVIITDAAGRLVRANAAARSLRGSCYWPRFSGITGGEEEPPVRPLATLLERLEWELARVLLLGEAVRDERIELLGADATRRVLSVGIGAVRNEGGEIVAAVVTLEDATARARLDALTPALESLGRL